MSTIYVIWARMTCRFKVGRTKRGVDVRLRELQANSPLPLDAVASWPGDAADEAAVHERLQRYRAHGEWFDLPESVVWSLLSRDPSLTLPEKLPVSP